MEWKTIAITEGVTIIVLLLLIIFRKIGRPLSEFEARERKKRKDEAKEKMYQEQRERDEYLQNQEREIEEMARPIKFISLRGDNLEGRTLCVQDGLGGLHTFHARDYELRTSPLFSGLYEASKSPHYHSDRGAVLVQ